MDKQTCGNSEHDSVPQHQELNKNQHISVCQRNFNTHRQPQSTFAHTRTTDREPKWHWQDPEGHGGSARRTQGAWRFRRQDHEGHGGSARRTPRGMVVHATHLRLSHFSVCIEQPNRAVGFWFRRPFVSMERLLFYDDVNPCCGIVLHRFYEL